MGVHTVAVGVVEGRRRVLVVGEGVGIAGTALEHREVVVVGRMGLVEEGRASLEVGMAGVAGVGIGLVVGIGPGEGRRKVRVEVVLRIAAGLVGGTGLEAAGHSSRDSTLWCVRV